MATVTMAPGIPSPQTQSDETLSTLPDPRTPLTPPEIPRSNSVSPHHPEISKEIAALSNKLIHAINHQTDLDDNLSQTRHQLDAARERIRQLEYTDQEHRSMIDNRILVRWTDVENDTLRLRVSLADERKQRVQVEKDKKAIEQELENLTAALFEEANQMVSAARKDARKEREAAERRNEQLQAQLNDSELLLASHQEQLAELKQAMSEMPPHRNDLETATSASTAPSTPALDTQEHINKLFDVLNLSPTMPGGEDVPPAPPTSFGQLISPVLRTDVQAFEDFHALLDISRKSGPPSRVTSGNYGGFNGLGLSNLGKPEHSQLSSHMPSNGSTTSLSASNTYQSSPSTPNLPPSTNTSVSSRDGPVSGTLLKETVFYKRVLAEDIEPTLRLDTAPGLSWLARRGVISSMCDGKLVVEPMPATAKLYHPPCSLCGEQGRGERRARTHRFRTNESETAQRYPLCEYCLNRVRSTCDFLGFLRMVKDGHWRTDGPQAESMAWEESVRLRERMFWSRIGGGVVPAFLRAKVDSSRSSTDDSKPVLPLPGSQTSLSSQDNKPDQPSPLGQEVGIAHATPPAREHGPEDVPVEPSIHAFPESKEPSRFNISSSVEMAETGQHSEGFSLLEGKDSSASKQDSPPTNGKQPSLTRMAARSRDSSRTEGSGRTINSIAKRAAIFEKSAPDDATSNQLQASLQASLKPRSPGGKQTTSSSVPGAFE